MKSPPGAVGQPLRLGDRPVALEALIEIGILGAEAVGPRAPLVRERHPEGMSAGRVDPVRNPLSADGVDEVGHLLLAVTVEEEVEEEQGLLLDTVLDVPLPRSAGKGPATDQWRPSSSAAVQHSYLDESKPKAPWEIMRR